MKIQSKYVGIFKIRSHHSKFYMFKDRQYDINFGYLSWKMQVKKIETLNSPFLPIHLCSDSHVARGLYSIPLHWCPEEPLCVSCPLSLSLWPSFTLTMEVDYFMAGSKLKSVKLYNAPSKYVKCMLMSGRIHRTNRYGSFSIYFFLFFSVSHGSSDRSRK